MSEYYLLLPAPDVGREAGSSSRMLVAKVKARGKSRHGLQPTLPPPLTPKRNSGDLCSNPLCCLVAQPSTSRKTQGPLVETSRSLWILTGTRMFALLAQKQHTRRYFSLKWPYILASLYYCMARQTTPLFVWSLPGL